jgi:hypothetical protein
VTPLVHSTPRWLPLVAAASSAFTAATTCWVVWGITTPGDFFAHGSVLFRPTLAAAALLGAALGCRVRSRRVIVTLLVFAVLCGAFWVVADDGWWVTALPN